MEIEVLKEKDNVFLGRKELELEIRHVGATPSKVEIIKELATKYSVPEDHVVLDFMATKKGTTVAVGRAKIYKEKPVIKVKAKKEKGPEKPKQEEKKASETKA